MREIRIFNKYILYEDGTIFSEYVGRKLTLHPNGRGYMSTVLRFNGGCVNIRVHRLVAENFVENPNGFKEVNHIDGDKRNNHSSNLEWCTRTRNIQHAYDNELRKRPVGENNPRNIISENKVREICIDLLQGGRTVDIARKHGVKRHNVDAIRKKRNWSTISDEYFDGVI